MSYTNIEQVRHHLATDYPVSGRVLDRNLTLTGLDYIDFHSGSVLTSSLRVKSVRDQEVKSTTVVLQNGRTSLGSSPVVSGSVVVASDSSLGVLYEENTDYICDAAAGQLLIKDDGAIAPNAQLAVWYLPCTEYVAGVDYAFDTTRGRIKRLAGGSIADGETVRLDYEPVYLSVVDETVERSVALANGMIAHEVDPERQFEVDPTLSAAATYRALEIVCRAAATRQLSGRYDGASAATAWMKLADVYSNRSDLLLRSFRPPYDGPRTPRRS